MIAFFVAILLYLIIIYNIASKSINSYLNGLTLIYGLTGLRLVSFFGYYIIYNKVDAAKLNVNEEYIFLACIFYIVYFLFISIGYMMGTKYPFYIKEIPKRINLKIFNFTVLVLIIVLTYILIKPFGIIAIINPRELYTSTRLGYGNIYFMLGFLIRILLITSFIYGNLFNKIISFILMLFITYIMGSKGAFLGLFVLLLFIYVFKRKRNISLKNIIIISFLMVPILFVTFYIFTPFARNSINDLITFMIHYLSEPNRNFAAELNYLDNNYNGILTFQNNFYALIPRFVFPGKPKLFGSFIIAYKFYPEWTLSFVGTPSFGLFGTIFADFGYLSLIFISINSLINGFLIGSIEKGMRINGISFISITIFLTLIGLPLLNVGLTATSIVLINIVLILLLSIFISVNKYFNIKFYLYK
jgi:oligosaccharide repeat unit polymerase